MRETLSPFVAVHPVLTVFFVALALRAVMAIGIFAMTGGYLFNDDREYGRLAYAMLSGDPGGVDPAHSAWRYQVTATFYWPLSALFALVGPLPLAGQLHAAVLGAATAAIATRIALEVVEWRWAVLGGLAVAVLPSQVLWSSLVLKDSTVWVLMAALGLVVAVAGRTYGPRLLAYGVAAGVLLVLIAYVRQPSIVIAAWALLIAAWFGIPRGRLVRGVGAAVLAITIPLAIGFGPLGLGYIQYALGGAAVGTNAAVTYPDPEQPAPADPGTGGTGGAPADPGGGQPVPTGPDLEDRQSGLAFGANTALDTSGGTVARWARGVAVMTIEPLPWNWPDNSRVRAAMLDLPLWYVMLGLSLVALAAVRWHLRVVAFPLLVASATVVTYALVEGNFGTAFRHRGEFVWVAGVGTAIGAATLASWWGRSRSRLARPVRARPAV